MDNNVVVNGRTFNFRSSSEKNGTSRVDSSTGLNTPTLMSIKQARFLDIETRLPGHATSVKFELPLPVQGGLKLQNASVVVTVRTPVDVDVAYSDVEPLILLANYVLETQAMRESVCKDRTL